MDDRQTPEWMPHHEHLEPAHTPTAEDLVLGILSEHLDLKVGLVRPWHRIRDLGLTPLALVLVSLEFEELEGPVLAYEDLENVKTVAGLIRLVQQSR